MITAHHPHCHHHRLIGSNFQTFLVPTYEYLCDLNWCWWKLSKSNPKVIIRHVSSGLRQHYWFALTSSWHFFLLFIPSSMHRSFLCLSHTRTLTQLHTLTRTHPHTHKHSPIHTFTQVHEHALSHTLSIFVQHIGHIIFCLGPTRIDAFEQRNCEQWQAESGAKIKI